MEIQYKEIKFNNYGKEGRLAVVCKINTDPVTSGFELIEGFVPDLNICIGYPTLKAYVKEFSGFGFTSYCGFIQVITIDFYANEHDEVPYHTDYSTDVTPFMQANGLPFYAYGYPAEFYDAPCSNFGPIPKIIWKANTFLVEMPILFKNNDTILFSAGFEWGFIDRITEGKKETKILPVESIGREQWVSHFALLENDFPRWKYR